MVRTTICRCILVLAIVAGAQRAATAADGQWRTGRATHYGGHGDPWTIHQGSCGYSYLDPTRNKGWDIAALSDAAPDYSGSCGRCYEIACDPMHIYDGYGTGLNRTNVCYDTSQSVTVMITDTCPCDYPANYYSNKRWCCNDMYHFDISKWTFDKLADAKYGVIAIKYREVPCDYCPTNEAQMPNGQQPMSKVQDPPPGWQPDDDKRPYGKMCFKSSLEPIDDSGSRNDQSEQRSSQQQLATAQSSSSTSASSWSGSGLPLGGNLGNLFGWSSMLGNWKDLSYNVKQLSAQAPDGSNAYCRTLEGYGAVLFKGDTGTMQSKKQLNLNVKLDSNGDLPDVTLSLASSTKGNCRSIDLKTLSGARKDDWVQVSIPLMNLSWLQTSWLSSPIDFQGCSNSIGSWDIDQLELKNKLGSQQQLCISDVSAW